VSAKALRGGGGADSFVQFPLEKGSRKVYNYSTNIKLSSFCSIDFSRLIALKKLSKNQKILALLNFEKNLFGVDPQPHL
jgi:hypothetical protein